MKKYGIDTTEADYWVHLFPLEAFVYWYRVIQMRDWIERNNPKVIEGRSKDGTVTGRGYLVPRSEEFVSSAQVPVKFLQEINWTGLTDREFGLHHGQSVVRSLIEEHIVRFSALVKVVAGKRQYKGIDFEVNNPTFEVKTERVPSGNLYVQTEESGHRVHQVLGSEGEVIEKITESEWEKFHPNIKRCHCGAAAQFGYRELTGMVWYCGQHRRAQWWADARCDGSSSHPILSK